MSPRMLNIVLLVQALFAGALLYIGYVSRENRRYEYLELTHRVTEGQASAADFEKLGSFLQADAGKAEARMLFGLPVARATQLELKDTSTIKGEFWIYYTPQQTGTPESSSAPVDASDVEKLKGPIQCFVIEFDKKGRAKARMESVVHPLK